MNKVSSPWKDAIWQYIIDHSTVEYDGKLLIRLCVSDQQDFWNRVYARKSNKFKRNNLQDINKLQEINRKMFISYRISQEKSAGMSKRCNQILNNGTTTEKILYKLYKYCRNTLFVDTLTPSQKLKIKNIN